MNKFFGIIKPSYEGEQQDGVDPVFLFPLVFSTLSSVLARQSTQKVVFLVKLSTGNALLGFLPLALLPQ